MTAGRPKPLAVTMGEPGGIAPDITVKAWLSLRSGFERGFFIIGDMDLLKSRAKTIGDPIAFAAIDRPDQAPALFAEALPVLPHPTARVSPPGRADPANSKAVIGSIERAVTFALSGDVGAMVTNPIHKKVLYSAGFRHTGHTDFIAALARAQGHRAQPVMMLAAPGLRTVPLTVHIPLRDVALALSSAMIQEQALVVNADLKRYFGIAAPRIAVTGLNPHAGEGGALGEEERSIITPAIEDLRRQGLAVEGPIAADSAFHPEARAQFDVVICMFHDQALIPVKTIGFHEGVNATLGLPFIRTSPDHGTALSLAGTGKANPRSLISALQLAAAMADHAQQPP
jgi:4-hydroxythreonine-4-phosphate dehydrogenase